MALKTVFDRISKHLKARQKYSAARRIFNSLLGVWKCDQTLSCVFDVLHQDLEQLTVPLFMGESGTVFSSSGVIIVVSLRGYAT